jgi:hypothetical protein
MTITVRARLSSSLVSSAIEKVPSLAAIASGKPQTFSGFFGGHYTGPRILKDSSGLLRTV